MGIELDVLVGHPEHDLLFVATQVARAAGLKHPSMSIQSFKGHAAGVNIRIGDLPDLKSFFRGSATLPNNTWLFDEARVYAMLLRGQAPASEPFRKWVTEEVLPTIRKTGKYNAEDSTNPIAVGLMDELRAVRGELADIKALIQGLNLTAASGGVKSPYEKSTRLAEA